MNAGGGCPGDDVVLDDAIRAGSVDAVDGVRETKWTDVVDDIVGDCGRAATRIDDVLLCAGGKQ